MDLIDCLHEIIPENLKYLSDEEEVELYELCYYLMEEFVSENIKLFSEEDFSDEFDENIYELIHSMFDESIYYTEDFQEEINEIIDYAKNDFFEYVISPRSYSKSIIIKNLNDEDKEKINQKITKLQLIPQPAQRTNEWYQYRYNLITASNAYKIFESQSMINQLIYEKCKPIVQNNLLDPDVKIVNMVNINTTLHWGNKYEILSVKLYENRYNTIIGDFGCIKHEKYTFLGASPDGINIDKNNERYGRMLEIKNIVNREITGIPKKEYWIQMQLQMEVCNLDECDFLETKFVEYEDYHKFKEDSLMRINNTTGEEYIDLCTSLDNNKLKGLMIHFHKSDGSPHYVYKPLTELLNDIEINEWVEEQIFIYEGDQYKYMYINIIYWKLDYVSCVLVCRNQEWFNSIIGDIERTWNIIKNERTTGFEHRIPKKKYIESQELITQNNQQNQNDKNDQLNQNNIKQTKINVNFSVNSEPKCLLKIIKK